MPTARYELGSARGSDNRIYAIGGTSGLPSADPAALDTVESYDPATDSWTSAPSLGTARNGPGVTAGNDGRIYAFGGANNADGGPKTRRVYLSSPPPGGGEARPA